MDANLARVYVTEEAVKAQRERYISVVEDFAGMYEDGEISLFSFSDVLKFAVITPTTTTAKFWLLP